MHKILIDFLNSLETPDFIAEFFERMGVVGNPEDGESCVITNWLLQSTDLKDLTTEPDSIHIFIGDEESHELSPAVSMFIEAFDNGKYPNLIDSCDEGYNWP